MIWSFGFRVDGLMHQRYGDGCVDEVFTSHKGRSGDFTNVWPRLIAENSLNYGWSLRLLGS